MALAYRLSVPDDTRVVVPGLGGSVAPHLDHMENEAVPSLEDPRSSGLDGKTGGAADLRDPVLLKSLVSVSRVAFCGL